jgi:hypothetical protein
MFNNCGPISPLRFCALTSRVILRAACVVTHGSRDTMATQSSGEQTEAMIQDLTTDNFSFTPMENIFRHLRFSSCGETSLTRGWVSNLLVQVLLCLASSPTELDTISCCLMRWVSFSVAFMTRRAMVAEF